MDESSIPVKDPTANVLDLVNAAIRRQDDLREQSERYLLMISNVNMAHEKELREKEAERINAIRAVDVAAVQRAAEVADVKATALANQVVVSAEALRTQVAATASAQTIALSAALEPVQKDIADLRRVQYEGVGSKTQIVESTSQSGSRGMWIGVAVAVAGVGLSFISVIGAVLFAVFRP
jgi:hypothetical protein